MFPSLRVLGASSVKRAWPLSMTSFRHLSRDKLLSDYEDSKLFLESKTPPPDVDKFGVFSNDHLNLENIDVYGFDYDYTLTSYKEQVEYFIHEQAKKYLVKKYKYPNEVLNFRYDPSFCTRGLHYDVDKGLLFKVDSFHQIQLRTVYRGRQQLTDEEVLKIYKRRYIPLKTIEAQFENLNKGLPPMVQLVDIFAKPLMCLLADVMDWFENNSFEYVPNSIYHDVNSSISMAHPEFHKNVRNNPGMYMEEMPELEDFLMKLKNAGKTLFVITNSPYETVDIGLKFMIGGGWRDYFQIVIIQANKPHFFRDDSNSYFREYDPNTKVLLWDKVGALNKKKIYSGGNLKRLQELTGWRGDQVLYFGDHPYVDLADLTLHHGWRTGAIIRELEDEIETMNSPEAKYGVNWSTILQALLEKHQDYGYEDSECRQVLECWKEELRANQNELKSICNPQFGSIFRTHINPTYFSRRLFRFADIYTSKVTNLLKYSTKHSFYPRRGGLPHEFRHWTN